MVSVVQTYKFGNIKRPGHRFDVQDFKTKDNCMKLIHIIIFTLIVSLFITDLHRSEDIKELETQIESLKDKVSNQNVSLFKCLETINMIKTDLSVRDVLRVTVTAYSPRKQETDDTPLTTAFMKKVRVDTVAVSRNIMNKHGWAPGDKIYVEGVGIRTIGDLMNIRYDNRIDIFYWDTEEALSFGKKENVVVARLRI